jgi:hypothetical protein
MLRNQIDLNPLKTKETGKWLIQCQSFQRLKGSHAKRRFCGPQAQWEGSATLRAAQRKPDARQSI